MTVSLLKNFFANARALTFKDANGVVWTINANTNELSASVSGAAGGTVTSVGLADGSTTPIYSISGSPVSASGTLTYTLKNQNANLIFAGPGTGAAAQPAFRALVAADIQTLAAVNWTGNHVFNPATGTPINVKLNGTTVFIANGITGATLQGYGPTAAGLVDMTPDTGSFTATLVGCTTSPTGTAVWARNGNMVTVTLPGLNGTSNSTGLSITGLPTEIQPTRTHNCAAPFFQDAGVATAGVAQVNNASGTIVFFKGASTSAASWTNSSTAKGLTASNTFTYFLS